MILFVRLFVLSFFLILGFATNSFAADDEEESNPLASLPLRHIGPAITSGRISYFAFYPGGDNQFLVGVSSGNVFSTDNSGISCTPLFENEGSYAIGVVELNHAVDMQSISYQFVAEGVWVRPFGKLVYLMPPYVIKDPDLRALTRAVVNVVKKLSS